MEVYILDSLLRRERVIDRFESCIWTERYAETGDFELKLHSTIESRALFLTGIKLACNVSKRIMEVETVENKTDADGAAVLTVKGRSMEKIMEDRLAKATNGNLTADPKWTITGTPAVIARKMFDDICRLGKLSVWDKIPMLMPGSIYPASSIGETALTITWEQEPDTLYNALKKLCDLYDMGFRLVRNFDTSQLYFDIYTGSDRTTAQRALNPVIFSTDLGNLQNTTELTTIEETKNVAYVYSSQGFRVVYPIGVDPEVDGFDRRVLFVKANDLETPEGGVAPTTTQINAYLDQAGLEALSERRSWTAFDGELNQNSAYKYEKDYYLGDLVDIRNADGAVSRMRVTEQIFVSDSAGERSYPTLAINLFVTPGSWLAWPATQVWEDLGATEFWADQI